MRNLRAKFSKISPLSIGGMSRGPYGTNPGAALGRTVYRLSVGGRLPPAGGFLPHSENTRRERRSSVIWLIKKGQLLFI